MHGSFFYPQKTLALGLSIISALTQGSVNAEVSSIEAADHISIEQLSNQISILTQKIEELENKNSIQNHPVRIGMSGELYVFESSAGRTQNGSPLPARSQLFRLSPLVDFDLSRNLKFHSRLTFLNAGAELSRAGVDQRGSTFVERAYLEYEQDAWTIQAGHLGLPFGFYNRGLDPQTYYGARPSELETELLPGPWSESGLWGTYRVSQIHISAGVFNSLNAQNFRSNHFLKDGRQNSQSALSENLFAVGQVSLNLTNFHIGATYGFGNTSQNVDFLPPINLQITELFLKSKWRSYFFEALLVQADVSGADALSALNNNETFGSQARGAMATVGSALPLPEKWGLLEGFYQWTAYDLHATTPSGQERNLSLNRRRQAVGLQYAPMPQLLVKLDYLLRTNKQESEKDQWRFNLGFLFP